MNVNDVLTDPKKLVAQELKNAGFDIETMKVPRRVYLLADSLYDMMLEKTAEHTNILWVESFMCLIITRMQGL